MGNLQAFSLVFVSHEAGTLVAERNPL